MPPPRPKLHKTTGKTRLGSLKVPQSNGSQSAPDISNNIERNITEPQPGTSSAENPSTSVGQSVMLTPEQEEQFQSELYWCIEQLQKALSTGKLKNKQVIEHAKALSTLKSNTTPMVKKRQVMRMSFGDYRKKMLEDERKAKQLTIKMGSSKPSERSVFIRKAFTLHSGNNFTFDFPKPEDDCQADHEAKEKDEVNKNVAHANSAKDRFILTPSSNTFRFNFSNDESQNNEGS